MKKLMLLGALLMAGCTDHRAPKTNTTEVGVYSYDPRADVCFMSRASGNAYGGTNFTAVPCTDKVKVLAGIAPPPPLPSPKETALAKLTPEERAALGVAP
jgi:hypothetical protein